MLQIRKQSLSVTQFENVWAKTWTQLGEFQIPSFDPISSGVFDPCFFPTVDDPLFEISMHWLLLPNLLCSLSKSFSRWKKKARRTWGSQARRLQTFLGPGWHLKPPNRFQPRQGSAAARIERLQSFSYERVGWWITCINTFSRWETSWQAVGTGDADTLGRRIFCSLLAPVPSCTHDKTAQVETDSHCISDPLGRIGQRQGAAVGQPPGILPRTQEWLGWRWKVRRRKTKARPGTVRSWKQRPAELKTGLAPQWLPRDPCSEGSPMPGLSCSVAVILKFLIVLSLNLGFVRKSNWTTEHALGLGASAGVWSQLSHLPPTQDWFSAAKSPVDAGVGVSREPAPHAKSQARAPDAYEGLYLRTGITCPNEHILNSK